MINLFAKNSNFSFMIYANSYIVLPASFAVADLRSSNYLYYKKINFYLCSQGSIKFLDLYNKYLLTYLRLTFDDVLVN